MPAIGLGTWQTFNIAPESPQRGRLLRVLQEFLARGGGMIDSSPMYGHAEEALGEFLPRAGERGRVFAATKVWTWGKARGVEQMERSRQLWGVARFDLMQIHNLLDWETHLETLRAMQAEGRVRYLGITTSHGLKHEEMERALRRHRFDFVQFTYNLADRSAEQRLLPLAQERGSAVIANRPFDGGALFARVRGRPLPDWAREFDCANWAQFFLKFVISRAGVTCAIPATGDPAHLAENMGAGLGRLPDAALRARMLRHFESL